MLNKYKPLIAVNLGHFIYCYDYALYASFAWLFSDIIFAGVSAKYSLILSYILFSIPYFITPFGVYFISQLGDKIGRKLVLEISISISIFSSFCIGLIPTYNDIGIASPIMLMFFRALNGLSFSSEISSVFAMSTEHYIDSKYRYLIGSIAQINFSLGIGIATGISLLLSHYLSPEDFKSWGWRIPFLLSGIIGIICFVMRRNLKESIIFETIKIKNKFPFKEIFKKCKKVLFFLFSIELLMTLNFYIVNVFSPSTLLRPHGINTYLILFFNMIVGIILKPLFALYADKFNDRKKIYLIAGLIMVLIQFPGLYILKTTNSLAIILLVNFIWYGAISAYAAINTTTFSDVFKPEIRVTGISIALSINNIIINGFLSLIISILYINYNILATTIFMITTSIIGLISIYYNKSYIVQNNK
ncbi:MAG: MFS transporter [Anaplasmataceae bacterium]|nr:MFS transporter [Anaplasmataceae bacterium]